MAALGYQRVRNNSGLRLEDMWVLDDDNTTEGVIKEFLPYYEAEIRKKANKPTKKVKEDGTPVLANQQNILYPLLKTFGVPILGTAVVKLVASLLTFVAPTVLNSLITFVQTDGKKDMTLLMA